MSGLQKHMPDKREGINVESVLTVRGLTIGMPDAPPIVDNIDLDLRPGCITCLVGESGSGKSITALSLMRLLPPGIRFQADMLALDGEDLRELDDERMNVIRGDRMAMVFQEPMTALNPVMTVGEQITEALRVHKGMDQTSADIAALEMFRQVQIPAPDTRLKAYPHQLSGGMRQRVMIAIALVCRPEVLIADEPTTALDVTIQSQILRLIDALRVELRMAVLLITHNLSLVAEIADDVVVMYAGRIVERAPRDALFGNPMHPYTLALFAARPRADGRGRPLATIGGQVPSHGEMPPGCRFAARCPFAEARCVETYPILREIRQDHWVSCWRVPLEDHVS